MTESLGFLLSDTSRLMRRRFDERARELGVTRAQWRTLTTLSRNEGLNQGALAELLEVEPITLCRMIDRLEESGLVERRRDPKDRRAWLPYLTGKSLPLLDDLKVLAQEMIEQTLTGISQNDRQQLIATLAAIHGNLTEFPSPNKSEAAHG